MFSAGQRDMAGIHPSNPNNPEGNWTDASGQTYTRSGWGLWVQYSDNPFLLGQYIPPTNNFYTPIDLLRMHDGTRIQTPEEWWSKRRPEIVSDIQNLVYGVIPDASVLPVITWATGTPTYGMINNVPESVYREVTITGTIDISRYPAVRNRPVISATLRTPQNAVRPVPTIIMIGNSVIILPS